MERKLVGKERSDEQGLGWKQPLDLSPASDTAVAAELSTKQANGSRV